MNHNQLLKTAKEKNSLGKSNIIGLVASFGICLLMLALSWVVATN